MKNRRKDPESPDRQLFLLVVVTILIIWILYLATDNGPAVVQEIETTAAVSVIRPPPPLPPVSRIPVIGDISEDEKQEQTCRPPSHIDPNDPIVKHYVKKMSFSCPYIQPLTALDQKSGLLTHTPGDSYSCSYSFFRREDEADNYINYEENIVFDNETAVFLTENKNLVNTSCYNENGEQIYANTHLFVPKFRFPAQKSDKVSVFVLFLESLPQLSFTRFMPKTRAALDDLGDVQYLKYFVKPMDNSFPNTMAFLTGKRIPWSEELLLKKGYMDGKFQFLWDRFSNNGYRTAFEEDLAVVGVFNYGKWGFKNTICDYNPRAFWVQMYPETGDFQIGKSMADKRQFCFRKNGPKISVFFNHAKELLTKNQEIPLFSFFFYSQMTHENFNNYQLVDPFVADLFSGIKNLLNNTILVFAGDHGFRMGTFVPTSMGRIEERMNLVSIRIPPALHDKHPYLRKYLKLNENRLTSWYDIHKMLTDVADGHFSPQQQEREVPTDPSAINPTVNLIPKNRTCADAHIDDIYCVCNDRVNVDPDGGYKSWDVNVGSAAVQQLLDTNLSQCHPQSVNRTLKFQYVIPGPGEPFTPTERAEIEVLLLPANVTTRFPIVRDWQRPEFEFEVEDNDLSVVRSRV